MAFSFCRRLCVGGTISRHSLKLFFLCVCFLCLGLGSWQIQRLSWKKKLIQQRETRSHLFLPHKLTDTVENAFFRVKVRGIFRHDREVFLQGRRRKDVWGADLITPFQLKTGGEILIHRGWVSLPQREIVPRPQEETVIEGLLAPIPQSNFWTPANSPSKNQWYWIDPQTLNPKGFQKIYLIAQAPFVPVLMMTQGLSSLPQNHLGYALTWFSLAFFAALFAFAPYLFSKKRRK